MTDLLGVWRHYKGHVYEVLGVSKHSETLEETVIYRNIETGEIWNRPVAMWTETVEGKLRFERLSNDTTVGKLKARVEVLEQQLHEPGYVDALRNVVEEVGSLVPEHFRQRPEIAESDLDMLELLPALVGRYIEHLKDTSATLKELKEWRTANPSEDRPLPEDRLIEAAHPMETDLHALYADAVRMVGAKHSKYALVDLVNWLLVQIECLKKLHGRPILFSQRQMLERSDLKACAAEGEKQETFVRELMAKEREQDILLERIRQAAENELARRKPT